MNEYQILIPVENDLYELIILNTYYFAKTEQTNKALNIPDEMYRSYAEYICTKAVNLEQILIAKQKNNIIGFIIWEDFCKPLVEGIKANPEVYKLIAPELEFVKLLEKELNKNYQFIENECAKLMQVGVLPDLNNKGIATELSRKAISYIREKKYKYIIADCTADNSWRVLHKLGFEILIEISFSDFEYKGFKTFAGLEGNRRLVIKQL